MSSESERLRQLAERARDPESLESLEHLMLEHGRGQPAHAGRIVRALVKRSSAAEALASLGGSLRARLRRAVKAAGFR